MHARRIAYYVVGEGVVTEPAFISSAAGLSAAAAAHAPGDEPECAAFKFGRLFPKWGEELDYDRRMKIARSLIDLGMCMDNPEKCHEADVVPQEVSKIPAGYTYLGQFIAHEITFDKTDDLLLIQQLPVCARSPSLDLDSLYGAGPDGEESKKLYVYEDGHAARLKIGRTEATENGIDETFENDLPRDESKEAIIADPRNEENLPVAQTHVAFIRFHNRVVADLEEGAYKDFERPPREKLFETAREEVVKHFQWIILKDYLPEIVDSDVLASVIRKPELFTPASEAELFMPLEFSAAAFRIGHSMVRRRYNWNCNHPDVALRQLFSQTKLSGNLGGLKALSSDWVIDWKRFYDFREFDQTYPYEPLEEPPDKPSKELNMAGRFDTVFDLHLDTIKDFKHLSPPEEQPPCNYNFNKERPLTVRNLLRGFALGLPWGEDVARLMGEDPLTPEELRRETDAKPLDAEALGGKTPLWFYVLKEARERGREGKLGRVGSRIVAETLVGLIRHSRYSILRKSDGGEPHWELSGWRPAYCRGPAKPETFGMVDLLRAAGVVDPLGKYIYDNYPH